METKNVFVYMLDCISRKREIGKESTADLYRATCNRLIAFQKMQKLDWKEVTKEFVDRFAAHLKEEKLKTNSINSYLSNFRAMYNAAVKEQMFISTTNPFSHLKLKREKTEKRALPRSVIEKIAQMNLENRPELKEAADYYLFSYLACGMPLVDMAWLTTKNIQGDRIIYNRIKTNTKVTIGITPGMRLLLKRYKKVGAMRIFPLLPDEEKIPHEVYKRSLRHINDCLKEIGEMLGIDIKLTTYVARHSWATEAQEQNLSITEISQSLGHTSENTTRIYLAGLSQDKLNKANIKVVEKVDHIVCLSK